MGTWETWGSVSAIVLASDVFQREIGFPKQGATVALLGPTVSHIAAAAVADAGARHLTATTSSKCVCVRRTSCACTPAFHSGVHSRRKKVF